MALAIELAAARYPLLGLDGLAAGLRDPLRLLGSEDGARQRSLRATIGWSVDLLDDEAREVFAALCVFAGPFTVASTHTVAQPDRLRQTQRGCSPRSPTSTCCTSDPATRPVLLPGSRASVRRRSAGRPGAGCPATACRVGCGTAALTRVLRARRHLESTFRRAGGRGARRPHPPRRGQHARRGLRRGARPARSSRGVAASLRGPRGHLGGRCRGKGATAAPSRGCCRGPAGR